MELGTSGPRTPQKRPRSSSLAETPPPKRASPGHTNQKGFRTNVSWNLTRCCCKCYYNTWCCLVIRMLFVVTRDFQVLLKGTSDSCAQHIYRSSGLKDTGERSVGRRNRPSIARQAMNDTKIRGLILKILEKDNIIQKELIKISAKKTASCLRQKHLEALSIFSCLGSIGTCTNFLSGSSRMYEIEGKKEGKSSTLVPP